MSDEGDRDNRSPRSRAAFAGLIAVLALAIAVLLGLGVWQLERRIWKLGLIAQIDARIHAPPTAVPGPREWPLIDAGKDAYRRVIVNGTYMPVSPIFSQATTVVGGGFWMLSPLKTDEGFIVLINRGFVFPEQRSQFGNRAEPARIVGLLRVSEPKGGFLQSNDPGEDRWYSRDVPEIAKARGLGQVAPYFIDAERGAPDTAPVGGLTVVDLPNNHLVYALTWFALALMAIAWLIYAVRNERS